MKRFTQAALAAVLGLGTLVAQASAPAAPAPQARAGDVDTLDHLVSALYDATNGPAGPRDWNRLRSLFAPSGRLLMFNEGKDGRYEVQAMSVEEYITHATPFFARQGFYERDVAHTTEMFGQIAHVFSTYEARKEKDASQFERGINSMQFYYDGKRWWTLTILSRGEDDKLKVPARYLKNH